MPREASSSSSLKITDHYGSETIVVLLLIAVKRMFCFSFWCS
jgi:hypothetical protein